MRRRKTVLPAVCVAALVFGACAAARGREADLRPQVRLHIDRDGQVTSLLCDENGAVFLERNEDQLTAFRAAGRKEVSIEKLLDLVSREGFYDLKEVYKAEPPHEAEEIRLLACDGKRTRNVLCLSPAGRPEELTRIVDQLLETARTWPVSPPGKHVVAEDAEVAMKAAVSLTGKPMLKAEFLHNLGVAFPEMDRKSLKRYPALRDAVERPGFPFLLASEKSIPEAVRFTEAGWAGVKVSGKRYGIRIYTW